MVMAKQPLGEQFGELRQQIIGIWSHKNQANDGALSLPQEYLLSVIDLNKPKEFV
jgi:hypothetical protein